MNKSVKDLQQMILAAMGLMHQATRMLNDTATKCNEMLVDASNIIYSVEFELKKMKKKGKNDESPR